MGNGSREMEIKKMLELKNTNENEEMASMVSLTDQAWWAGWGSGGGIQ